MSKNSKILSVVVALGCISGVAAQAQVTKDNLDQNADQAQGNYAATNLNYLGSGSLGMMQSAWKDPLQHMGEGQSRPGYTKYYWTPELVLPVRVREGMYTLINFPAWEVIENVYIGDGQSFNAEIQGPSSLMVYPEASQFVGVDTNMIVFGRSGNKYVFYVQSETVNTDRITNAIIDIEVVKKRQNPNGSALISSSGGHINANGYSADGSSVDATFTRNLQKEDWIEKIPVDPTQFRFDIEVYVPNPDDIIIAPERVWRDNIFTYIDLGEKALTAVQRPIVTLIVERSETPVGFRSAGPNNRLIIVEGMGDMVMRSGKRIVCLKLRRSDADGLENTVYAKTNDWDLQPVPSPATQEENIIRTDEGYQNVYGSSSEKGDADFYGTDAQKNLKKMDESGFFNLNSFSKTPVNAESGANYNGMQNFPPQNTFNVINGQNTSSVIGAPISANQGQKPAASLSLDNEAGLNALPKTTPVVASVSSPEKNTGNAASSSLPELTGQYEIKAGDTEIVTPDYNGAAVKTEVTYQAEPQKSVNLPIPVKNTQIGNSANNSSPVLISPKEELANTKSLVSAETEALLKEFRSGKAFSHSDESNISIELGTDEDVNNLEKLWSDISKRYSAALSKYEPYYSVDAPADGQGKDVFHLRVGPIKSLEEGDNICSQLGRSGIFCSVVRIQ